MSIFDVPIRDQLTATVHTVGPQTRLAQVDGILADTGVSGLPVVDEAMRPLGVITRTDLLHVGAVPAVTGSTERKMVVPDRIAKDIALAEPLCIGVEAHLRDAVSLMQKERVHRVLVVDTEGKLVGLVSVWDAMRVVGQSHSKSRLEDLMSSASSLVTVAPEQSVASAIERLRTSHVHGLIVLEDGWPVGVFSQEDALHAERWPAATQVEEWFDPALLVMPPLMWAHRAAAQAVATRCRHIVVMDQDGIRGLVAASDFLNTT